MAQYLTYHTVIGNYKKWNRKFRFLSFSAYQTLVKNLKEIHHAKDTQVSEKSAFTVDSSDQ